MYNYKSNDLFLVIHPSNIYKKKNYWNFKYIDFKEKENK